MANPELPSSIESPETHKTVFGTTDENEIWRIDEAKAFAELLAGQFHPNMSRAETQLAIAFMKERVVGTIISEYRIGHAHGQRTNPDIGDL